MAQQKTIQLDYHAPLTKEEQQELTLLRTVHFDWYSCEMALLLAVFVAFCFWLPVFRNQEVSIVLLAVVTLIFAFLLICFVSLSIRRSRGKQRFVQLLGREEAFREWERGMKKTVQFIQILQQDIPSLSAVATEVVRNHFDPLIGKEQNDYMLGLFQSQDAISEQLQHGYHYYWVIYQGMRVGFIAFYPRDGMMYLSKFYVRKQWRGCHLATFMVDFVCRETRKAGLSAIYLNVNRNNQPVIDIYHHLGFTLLREEKNDIGNGYYMDDLVLILEATTRE